MLLYIEETLTYLNKTTVSSDYTNHQQLGTTTAEFKTTIKSIPKNKLCHEKK